MNAFLLALLAASLATSSCYRPRLQDCKVACGSDKACAEGMTCSNGYCTTGPACSPECKVGQVRCLGARQVQKCQANGQWNDERVCDEGDGQDACFFGQCQGCVPGVVRCSKDSSVERCQQNDSGAAFQPVAVCLAPALCRQSACANDSGVYAVAAGGAHTCVATSDGVRCWGQNRFGQLGQGDRTARGFNSSDMGPNLPAVNLGGLPPASVLGVTAGGNHTCALLAGGAIKCWGDNSLGQLGIGQGDRRPRGIASGDLGDALPAVDLGMTVAAGAVQAGRGHTCALLGNGRIKCWGDNQFGQLGLGHFENIGDDADEMGDRLPTVDLGTGATVVALSVGAFHTCALLDGGQVKCWGNDDQSQLGQELRRNRGWKPDDMGDHLRAVDLGTGRWAVAIAAGGQHTCALLNDRHVKCWGLNTAGQLGVEGQAPALGNQLPPVPLGDVVPVAVLAGGLHTCVLGDQGRLTCWGGNVYGQLGRGDVMNRRSSSPDFTAAVDVGSVGAAPLSTIVASAGSNHSCALLNSGELRCWGSNNDGQLGVGLGPQDNLGDSAAEVGNNLPVVDLRR